MRTMGAVRPCLVYDRRAVMRGTKLEPTTKIDAWTHVYETMS